MYIVLYKYSGQDVPVYGVPQTKTLTVPGGAELKPLAGGEGMTPNHIRNPDHSRTDMHQSDPFL